MIEIGDGIATVYGLDKAVYGELVEFETGAKGIVLNLERDSVGVVLLGSEEGLAAVSYTHLDVYKRQPDSPALPAVLQWPGRSRPFAGPARPCRTG